MKQKEVETGDVICASDPRLGSFLESYGNTVKSLVLYVPEVNADTLTYFREMMQSWFVSSDTSLHSAKISTDTKVTEPTWYFSFRSV